MKDFLTRINYKLDVFWDKTPLVVRLFLVPVLLCIGFTGFILFCLAGPILVVLALGYQIFKYIKNAAR